jgi:hypothetical protein
MKHHLPRTFGPGQTGVRQVLRPGKRKAARHPWANRLLAARTAGFVVEQTGSHVQATCYACGAGFGISGEFTGSDEDFDTQQHFEADVRHHEARECVAVAS